MQIEGGVRAGLPIVSEQVAVEFVTSEAIGIDQGETARDGGLCSGWFGPSATLGRATILFTLPVAEVALEPTETGQETTRERGVKVRVKSTHGLAKRFADRLVWGLTGGARINKIARLNPQSNAAINTTFPADSAFRKTMRVLLKE